MLFKTELTFCSDVNEMLSRLREYPSYMIVADEKSAHFTGDSDCVLIPSGERFKTLDTVEIILGKAIEKKLGRDSFFVAMGGGVLSDVTSFAASIYMRGCRLVIIPTTLLGMVDASYGGKTGCNFKGLKNIVGTFYPADSIFICPDFLSTLPQEEYRNGMGEVIKTAVLDKTGKLLELLEKGINDKYGEMEMIRLSLKTKDEYIRPDLYDTLGIREAANLGHTFAHALESYSDYTVPHGIAVAWGLRCALKCGDCSPEYRKRVENVLEKYGLTDSFHISESEFDKFYEIMLLDKKKRNGELRLVIPTGQGKIEISSFSKEAVRRSVVQ